MIFISPTNTKRFTLYHMEENQIYIQDFFGNCTFFEFNANEAKSKDKGKFYMCSKTIVYESDNKNIPLVKFKFQSMKTLPTFNVDSIKFTITRITTIKVAGNSPPEPFRIFQDITEQITIHPSYENVKNLQEWIVFLYENSKKKSNYHFEQSVYYMIIDKFNKKSFNMSKIDSVSEKPMLEESNILTRRVLPLNTIYGYIFITDQKIYFQPFHNLSGNTVQKIQISKISKLFKKRYELRQIGLEITSEKGSYYFTFQTQSYRNRIYNILAKRVPVSCFRIDQLQNVTLQWQTKQITNYDYLMHLNQASNRSTSDLSQYPVFPWVIADYVSDRIDLNDPKIYRDLSKPIGAINSDRLQSLLERYQGMEPPKFMYGSHYSTPGYVIGYLVRKKPEYMLKLQSGRFDKPDRLFKSIKDDWYNVMQNPTSLKELIPQFYQTDSTFLKNYQNLDLGVRQNKKKVGDVKIPQWANGDPETYLKMNRQALQSQYVSQHLHEWIDLIFGYKQRGQQAIKAFNLFHPFTYEGMIDIQKIKDPIEKMGIKCQINQFGQCPKQIFKIPHPSRNSNQPIFADAFSKGQDEDEGQIKNEQQFRSVPIKINSMKNVQSSGLFSQGKPKVKTVISMGKQSQIKLSQISKAHKTQINRALHLKSKPNTLLTIGQDGFLKIFDVAEKSCTKSFKICEFNLSSIVMLKSDQIFAIGAWDNNIYIFNIVYGSKSKPYPAHDNSIIDIFYMPKRKTIISASWDCSIKMFRYVGSVLDNQQHFYDHENQITSIAVNKQQNIVAFGDIDGNVICLSIEDKEQLFNLNMNSQKITRMHFIQNNVIIAAENELRMVDASGSVIGSHQIDKNNGTINDIELDNEHLFVTTSNKQLILYDILQQKKIGNYFNDFTYTPKDKLPDEKGLTFITPGNDGLFLAIGGSSGTIYILRSG